MADYRHHETKAAMEAIRSMHKLLSDMRIELDRAQARYSHEVYLQIKDKLAAKYKEATAAARNAVTTAIKAAYDRNDRHCNDLLKIGNAEEDFKLLSPPITLTNTELVTLLNRNEGNALFARAVSVYADQHGYNDPVFRIARTRGTIEGNTALLADAEAKLMCYCEMGDIDQALSSNWQIEAFKAVDEKGLFANL